MEPGNIQTFVIPAQAGTHLRTLPMQREIDPCTYIMASHRNGTLYTGVTSNLLQRLYQHREGVVAGFTKQHGVHRLVWFEQHATMEQAILRERRIKKWNRAWKIRLIEEANPDWRDLALGFGFAAQPTNRLVRP